MVVLALASYRVHHYKTKTLHVVMMKLCALKDCFDYSFANILV